MHTLDVERGEALLDERREVRRERRFLDVVFPLEQINRIGVTGRDLLANVGGGSCQNASRIDDTMVRANSVLNRSSAFVSWPKKAVGSIAPCAVWLPVASYS